MQMDGLILVDKPKNWTSFDVVAKLRGQLRGYARQQATTEGVKKKIKVGHTGTLDPLATGLLVLTVGSYCKRAAEFSKLDKTYQVSMKLGQTSTTGDEEGEKQLVNSAVPAEKDAQDVLASFVGDIMQVPPAYSAIKIDGKRAYKLAREGKEVNLQPRPVKISSITEVRYEYPYVYFVADVSSGTYIRSLVQDIGDKLGTGAYMTDLRRLTVGSFKIQNAVTMEDVAEGDLHTMLVEMPVQKA